MAELTDGYYKCLICGVDIIESRFKKAGAFEIEFTVGVLGENGKPLEPHVKLPVYLEVSMEYGPASGNRPARTRKDEAFDTLKRLGFQGGEDLSRLGELKNKPCRINYQTKNKAGEPLIEPRAYITFRSETKKISAQEAMNLMRAMSGGVSASPFDGAAAPSTEVNPFD